MLWSNGQSTFFKSLNALGLLGQQRNGCMDLGWGWAARFGEGLGCRGVMGWDAVEYHASPPRFPYGMDG